MATPKRKKRELAKTYVNGSDGQVSLVIPADVEEVVIDPETRRVTLLLPNAEARRISRNLLASAQVAERISRENKK